MKPAIKKHECEAAAVARGEKAQSRAWKLRKKADGTWQRVAIDPELDPLPKVFAPID